MGVKDSVGISLSENTISDGRPSKLNVSPLSSNEKEEQHLQTSAAVLAAATAVENPHTLRSINEGNTMDERHHSDLEDLIEQRSNSCCSMEANATKDVEVVVVVGNNKKTPESPGMSEKAEVKDEPPPISSSALLNGTLNTIRLMTMDRMDPATCMYVTKSALTIGTIFGRVVVYLFERNLDEKQQHMLGMFSRPCSSCKESRSKPCRHVERKPWGNIGELWRLRGNPILLAGYSEDAIKAVYQSGCCIYALIGNSVCHVWEMMDESNISSNKLILDPRIGITPKYALNHHNLFLIPSTGATVLVNLQKETQHLWPFRLPSSDVVPMDFNGTDLLVYVHSAEDKAASVKVLTIPSTSRWEETALSVQCLFHMSLPGVTGVAHARFWLPDRLVVIPNGKSLLVYKISTESAIFGFKQHKRDIVALDASQSNRLVSISKDSIMFVINEKGQTILRLDIHPSLFDIGYSYLMCSFGDYVFYTCDGGVSYVMLDVRLPSSSPINRLVASG